MRLLLVTSEFPNPCDPAKAVFNLCLARALAQEHQVQVVAPISWVDECRARWRGVAGPGQCRSGRMDGIEVQYPRYFYPPRILRNRYGSFFWWSARAAIKRALKSNPPEVVVGYWAHPDGASAIRAARRAKVPAVIMVGGSDVLLLAHDAGRRRRILQVLHAADAIVTTSHDLKKKVVLLGVPAESVHVVHRGVDADRFSPGDPHEARRRLGLPQTKPIILWVGRMVPVKGLDVLLDACARLASQAIPFHACLIGDGPLRQSLEAQAAKRGLSSAFSFIGPLRHEELPDWFRAANVTVLPSRSEGVPNVLRESLACSTPFVASRVGGIPEIAEEGRSLLVPPNDSGALAEALRATLEKPADSMLRGPSLNGWSQSAESLLGVLRPLLRGDEKPSASIRRGSRHAGVP